MIENQITVDDNYNFSQRRCSKCRKLINECICEDYE